MHHLLTVVAALLAGPIAAQEIGSYQLGYPFPAPDGTHVVIQGNFDGRWQLYRIDLADGRISRLHTSPRDDTHPSISPDGRRVAFISNRDGNDEVYLLDLASGAARSVAPHPGKDGHPRWSSDGQWLVFNRTFDPADTGGDEDSAIMQVRADGSGAQVLSDSPRVETFASFSPDGRHIVFVEWFPDAAGGRNRNGELVVVDTASGQRRNITNSPGFDGYPIWGASGAWIYFSTVLNGGTPQAEMVVHRIRPDGTGLQRLGEIDGASDVRAVPDQAERILYFNVNRDNRVTLHLMAIPPGN